MATIDQHPQVGCLTQEPAVSWWRGLPVAGAGRGYRLSEVAPSVAAWYVGRSVAQPAMLLGGQWSQT